MSATPDYEPMMQAPLLKRLRGQYPIGPELPNGEPEFGWRQLPATPIMIEAAEEIEALLARVEELEAQAKRLGALPESDKRQLADFKAFLGLPEANLKTMEALRQERDAALARIAEMDRYKARLEHELALIARDVEPWRTDCSTPIFQMVRNVIEDLARRGPRQ